MHSLREKHWFLLFLSIAVLLVAQVFWWANVFLNDVREVQRLKLDVVQLGGQLERPLSQKEILLEADRRRVMFLSESTFFVLATCLGLYLLYAAVRSERRSKEIQKNFLEIVTHESKTPITALKLRLESWREEGVTPKEEEIVLALRDIARLTGLFEKALTLHRIEQRDLLEEIVDLNETIKQVLNGMDNILKNRKVEVELRLSQTVEVKGDPFYLQSLIHNLVENAVCHNPAPDKSVSITTYEELSYVVLEVTDNGPGLEAEDEKHLFEKFYRGKRSRQVPGTGLGLHLCKRIVEAHRGAICFFQKNGSALFRIELPAVVHG